MRFTARSIAAQLLFIGLVHLKAGPAISQQIEPQAAASSLPIVVKNGVGMRFVMIPAGEFLMGSPAAEKDRRDGEKQHRVRISRAFYLQSTEVTQGQWKSVMGTEPWNGNDYVKIGDDYAASYVNWDDAIEFCKKLSVRDQASYRLPTEAEWEFACRGGSNSSYSFGDSPAELSNHAWFHNNADRALERYAHVVGQKRANRYGLFDMHGNVWEWCADWHDRDYYDVSPVADPPGPRSGSDRVYRGGSWLNYAANCRSAYRDWRSPDFRRYHVGFRVLRVAK